MRVDNIMSSATLGLYVLVASLVCAPLISAKKECKFADYDYYDYYGYYDYYDSYDGYDGYYENSIINDNHTGVVAEITTENIEEITMESKYLKCAFDKNNNKVVISTTDEFAQYEDNEKGTEIEAVMTFICTGEEEEEGHKMIFWQPIKDINNHEPKFEKTEYNFVHYGSLSSYFDLTNLISISAKDLDCSANYLNFAIYSDNTVDSSSDLEITSRKQDGKIAYASITTNNRIFPPYEKKFTLTVRDGYYGDVKETNATFNLKLIESTYKLAFTNKSYSIPILNDRVDNQVDLIKIEKGIDSELKVTIEKSAYSSYFSAKIDYLTNSIKLSLRRSLPDVPTAQLSSSYGGKYVQEINLKLKATWKDLSAETDITVTSDKKVGLLCIVPGIDISDSSFHNPNKINDTEIGIIFKVSKTENVEDMQCDESSKYMKCNFNKENGEFTVSTTDEFKKYEETEKAQSMKTKLTIQCPYENKTLQFVQSIRDINNHEPIFSKNEYTYTFYTEIPEYYEITKLNEITVTDYDLSHYSCNFKFAKGDSEWFEIGYYNEFKNKTCRPQLSAINNIQVPFDKTLTLIVEDDKSPRKSTETKLHIQVLTSKTTIFKFMQNEYYMKLDRKSKTINAYEDFEIPRLVNGLDSSTRFTIDDKEYSSMFYAQADKLTGIIHVYVKESVVLCESCNFVTLPIKATWKGMVCNTTILVIMNDDFHPTTTTSISPSDGTWSTEETLTTEGTRATTTLPTVAPVLSENNPLSGINSFTLTSTIGFVSIFVTVTITLFAMIYITRRLFFTRREISQEQQHDHPLPEKMPIP